MHPIESILSTTMAEIKQMIDVNTIVGDPFVTPGGSTVIPISRVSFGFVSGGGEYGQSAKAGGRADAEPHGFPFAGGTASGISITPVAFMTADADRVRLLPASQRTAVDKVLESVPQMVREVKDIFSGQGKGEQDEEQTQ